MKILSLVLMLFLLSFGVYSQQDYDDSLVKISQTTKIDDFSEAIGNECDRTARLDQLAIALQANPAHKGEIIIYLGADQPLRFQTERMFQRYKMMMQAYLVMTRGLDRERLNFVNGGFRRKVSIELWVIPEKGETPKIAEAIAKPVVPADKVSLYDDASLTYPYEDSEPRRFLLASVKAEYDKREKEWEAEFGKEETANDEETKISRKEIEDLELSWAGADYGKLIKNQPDSKGVIIFYLDNTRLDARKVRKNLEKGASRIAQESGISKDRIKIVYGGYRDWVQADMWIVPKNVSEPKPSPGKREETAINN